MGAKLGLSLSGRNTESFENRGLRRIFEPKREEDASWRKFHNDELGGSKVRDHWADLGVVGKITLRWTLRR
jgi:hypothetical protein